jgi:anti-sigma28 factor (negative regulator of flagellin synthesis)
MSADGAARANRVQELAALYQSGNYKPDAMSISKGMVADALASGVE